MELTTREIAVLVWTGVFFLWILSKPGIRDSIRDVVAAAAQRSIIVFFLLTAAYAASEVILLRTAGFWSFALLKETLVWFTFIAPASALAAITTREAPPPYFKTFVDGLKIVVVLEFLFALFTFSLPIELVLVPFATLLALMVAIAEMGKATPRTTRFLSAIQAALGFTVLAFAARQAIADYSRVADPVHLQSFFLPLILSVMFIPAMFLTFVYSRYEWLFLKLNGDTSFRRCAKWKLARRLGPRPEAVLEFGRKHIFDLPAIRSTQELDELFEK